MLLAMGVSLIEIKFYAAKTDYQDCVLIRVHLSSSVVLIFFAVNGAKGTPIMIDSGCRFGGAFEFLF